ncbi:MAG: hypothetical protein AAF502_16985 [Bacteroidota bacterium]
MKTDQIFIGQNTFQKSVSDITGKYIQLDGESFYQIANYDQMRPFFMTIVSDSDHWMFISSNGALTAGRRNPENALFPYYSDDKIHDSADLTGSKTIILAAKDDKTFLWEPFSDKYEGIYKIRRNIYKNVYGNKVIFEETNGDLDLTFSYSWSFSDDYGFVKTSYLKNNREEGSDIRILDGIQNILPYGVDPGLQEGSSTLVDAYKKNELLPELKLGLYRLSSIPVDKAEPSEALIVNSVWATGLDQFEVLLSSVQVDDFRTGKAVTQEVDVRAERGAYFVTSSFTLPAKAKSEWYLVAELGQDTSDIVRLSSKLKSPELLLPAILKDIDAGTENLAKIVAGADGLQLTNNQDMSNRHFSNVLYNVMRGGGFWHNYRVNTADLISFLKHYNKSVAENHMQFLTNLPHQIDYPDLIKSASEINDPDLTRLVYEYMPISFSRRHGDPSRPWNKFSIEVKDDEGAEVLYYQGNWRDIFQNWEALGVSYPAYIESMICKFVNASTIDGYNPYRVTRDGIDWEIVEPDDPWSYIGYWGDHQIIYLLKLLEISKKHHPAVLDSMLNDEIFSFANVPYRIKSYHELLENPFDTVDFDHELETLIQSRVQNEGADGKLTWKADGSVYLVNLVEKLLIPVLVKCSNFIPEAGIWLNTQRPEWNDANNALVGRGVSMVTLYYMRRYQAFLDKLFQESAQDTFKTSSETFKLLETITNTFEQFHGLLEGPISDANRKAILDNLGKAGSRHRTNIYNNGPSGNSVQVDTAAIRKFISLSLDFFDHSIKANKREDGLYHAYNLMTATDDGVSVDFLYEMLEGQVSVLSSGYLSAGECLEVMKALRNSSLYREDQHSYILYPDRKLPRFTEKNNIPADQAMSSKLIAALDNDGNRSLVDKDINGHFHFNGQFRNANDVKAALASLKEEGYETLVKEEQESILAIFEQLFDHKSFTGRSGTFYGYEGLGSIYWHMVSKLLLAAMENCMSAIESSEDHHILDQLIDCYYDVRAGIGFNKTPAEYGAFPSDAYSHTPGNAGAQQPGMTGQVKEDILARFGELGVIVEQGVISFEPFLLKDEEYIDAPSEFTYYDIQGQQQTEQLGTGSLAFTYCQVPVIYSKSDNPTLTVSMSNGEQFTRESPSLTLIESHAVFNRTGEISKIILNVD